LNLSPQNEVDFKFTQTQDDGSVIEYAGTASGLSVDVAQDYDTIHSEYSYKPMTLSRSSNITAKLYNPRGTYKKTPKTGVVRTATVVVDKLTSHEIDEARRKAKVSSDMEFTVEEKVDRVPYAVDKRVGYSIKFVWTE